MRPIPPDSRPPVPQQPRPSTIHDEAAEEAARAAKRYHDQVKEIGMLGDERDEWKIRALTYEKEIERLEKRLSDLTADLEHRTAQLTHERDGFKNSLQALIGQFNTAGNIILDCMNAANRMSGPKADLKQLEAEIKTEGSDE